MGGFHIRLGIHSACKKKDLTQRRQDVFKALALGANAVAIARPVMYGLALGGWMGVQTVLVHLKGELEITIRLAGAKSLSEITKHYLNA
jgi:isopentenyl diphosphate isomerase/L-lactate dehydrogenase-like FMN-dependent dehydrogenase